MRSKRPENPLVCVIAYDGLCTFEFAIAVEAFGFPRPEFNPWYRFKVVSAEKGALGAVGGVSVRVTGALSELKDASLVIVPGWRSPEAEVPVELKRALLGAHRRGARIASICSGVFVLAQCGLLEGRKATAHWRHCDELVRRFPGIEVKPDVLYVDEGDVLTSAGAAAGLDLCLHIIRSDFGAKRANDLARRLVMPAHRGGGQTQFIPRPVVKERGSSVAGLLDTLRRRLDEDWTIARMADVANVSRRTLLRRFRDATGQSPQNWLVAERVERSKELLETTAAGLKEVAVAAGFSSSEIFRHHFRARVGVSPSVYRTDFGALGVGRQARQLETGSKHFARKRC